MVIKRDFVYSPTGKVRVLHIYLPDNYYETEERYPVMYFFDGHNLYFDEDATYGTSWGVKEFMDQWEKPMIIVGIECGHGTGERLNEYCPYKMPSGFCSEFDCIGDDTFKWIVDEIKPMIDQEYRTYPNRQCTGIAGSSMGGLMAVFGVIKYNDVFSKAACISSAIGFCMPKLNADIAAYPIDPDTRAFISWGTREAWGVKDHEHEDTKSPTAKNNHAVGKKLEAQGAAVDVFCQIGGAHCEADWRYQVPRFMDFLWMR